MCKEFMHREKIKGDQKLVQPIPDTRSIVRKLQWNQKT